MAKHDIHFQAGDVLKGRYEIIRQIGAGGMSAVYLAEDSHDHNQLWAVKVADMKQKISRRLFSEAKLLSELNHPGLPQIADFFASEDERYFFLVQEYVDGRSLLEVYENQDEPFSEEEVLNISLALAEILDYLHSQQPAIIYRDLKPGNIMITTNGQVKLIDFGIARKFDESKLKDTLQIGTVGFAAPEQFEKQQSDTRTDLFTLGALMYYLLSGGKFVYITQKPIQHFRTGLTKATRTCLEALVQLEPDNRPQSIIEVKEYLQQGIAQLRKSSWHPQLNWWLITKYSVSILSLIAVCLYIYFDQL
ncbi:serine/threonine protein kinase [Alkalihalobacillus sp. 1P02AB]|uniref:serine/threonine protein kinase n=1 Tax=Alkalihalobacillus sp. 1P02AB TaxID=3132260 RepID=UPI0039A4596A